MDEKPKAVFAKVGPGLFVGNQTAVAIADLINKNDISAIMYFCKKPEKPITSTNSGELTSFSYVLSSGEVMDSEIQKTTAKLETIFLDLKALRDNSRNVFLCCEEGRRQSMFVAGYFLIANGAKYENVITNFDTVLFTPQQKLEETQKPPEFDKPTPHEYHELLKEYERKLAERQTLRGLPNNSFKKILRLKGGAKK